MIIKGGHKVNVKFACLHAHALHTLHDMHMCGAMADSALPRQYFTFIWAPHRSASNSATLRAVPTLWSL
ncbi:hypothetical protein L484_006535 [Morus notabilis]|uniref:Uncharacterized protein n=1 Tax=Morus notabilis TaxID=981085 RepID=W9QXT6_9ROSA|nr:hypothetical protein L484_006535 [Morus notabilis]